MGQPLEFGNGYVISSTLNNGCNYLSMSIKGAPNEYIPRIMCMVQEFCFVVVWSLWHHQMETFSALLVICAGNSLVTSEFPIQRPVIRNFKVFFDLCLNKRLSKQSWGWWFETPSCSLWCHSNDQLFSHILPGYSTGNEVDWFLHILWNILQLSRSFSGRKTLWFQNICNE